MAFYENLRDNTATRLIKQYGAIMILTRESGGTYDPVTGQGTGSSVEEFPVSGVLTNIEEGSTFSSNGQSVGSTVMVGDRMVLLEASVEVLKGDKISIEGELWLIVDFVPTNPGGVTVVYELHVRK